VLEVVPVSKIKLPALMEATGNIAVDGERLVLTEVRGETGRTTELAVWLDGGHKITKASVNGREVPVLPSPRNGIGWLRVPVTFAGARVDHCQQVGTYDPNFADQVFRADLTIPRQVFDQLAERRKAWPVDYTQDELPATWRGPTVRGSPVGNSNPASCGGSACSRKARGSPCRGTCRKRGPGRLLLHLGGYGGKLPVRKSAVMSPDRISLLTSYEQVLIGMLTS
jgi:hypothetical protein